MGAFVGGYLLGVATVLVALWRLGALHDFLDDLREEGITVRHIRDEDPRNLTALGRLVQRIAGGPR